MDAARQSLEKYIDFRDKLKNESLQNNPNFLYVLLKECETILVQMVQAHKESREDETVSHNSESCIMCKNEDTFQYLINNRISLPPIPEAGPFNSATPSLCDQYLSHGSSKSSGQEDEEPEGDDVVVAEQQSSACCNLEDHTRETKRKYEAHKRFMVNTKNKINKERSQFQSKQHPLNIILTYYSANKEIMYGLFDDEQKARSWAYENVNTMEKHCPFILTWKAGRLKSSKLEAKHLAILKAELIHPLDSIIVIQKEAFYDTGGEIGSVPYNPQIAEQFINSATILNGNVVPTVHAKLRINGRMLQKIHEFELDSDDVACLGNTQVVEMRPSHVRKIMKRKTDVIISKRQ